MPVVTLWDPPTARGHVKTEPAHRCCRLPDMDRVTRSPEVSVTEPVYGRALLILKFKTQSRRRDRPARSLWMLRETHFQDCWKFQQSKRNSYDISLSNSTSVRPRAVVPLKGVARCSHAFRVLLRANSVHPPSQEPQCYEGAFWNINIPISSCNLSWN